MTTVKGTLNVDETLTSNLVDINGGSINDTAIGENIKSTGAFTTLSTSEILDAGGLTKAHSGLTALNGDLDVKNRIINDYLVSTDNLIKLYLELKHLMKKLLEI